MSPGFAVLPGRPRAGWVLRGLRGRVVGKAPWGSSTLVLTAEPLRFLLLLSPGESCIKRSLKSAAKNTPPLKEAGVLIPVAENFAWKKLEVIL